MRHLLLQCSTSAAVRTSPKTTCLPSNQSVFTVHRKNCEPLVLGPAAVYVVAYSLVILDTQAAPHTSTWKQMYTLQALQVLRHTLYKTDSSMAA